MKGILFSVGLTLMGLIVLGTALSLAQARSRENVDVLKFSIYDRIFDETKSIENSYRSLVSNVVTIGTENDTVTFEETLPNPGAADFILDAAKFEAFAKKFRDFELEVNIDENLSFFVLPERVIYTHPDGFGGGRISVTNATHVKKYDLSLSFGVGVNANWTTKNTDASGLQVHLHVEPGGYDETTFLSEASPSLFEIKSGANKLSMTFGPSNDLYIASSNLSAGITNSITLGTKPFSVVLNEESINITAKEYSISRVGPVRVL